MCSRQIQMCNSKQFQKQMFNAWLNKKQKESQETPSFILFLGQSYKSDQAKTNIISKQTQAMVNNLSSMF